MKKLIAITIMFFVASTTFAQNITGSEHDFSGEGWGTTEVCETCHTPHNADGTVAGAPLWNHVVTTTTFTLYNSATLTASDLGQPNGASKLCLSCHDGTVALDNFGGQTNGSNFISGGEKLGSDLSNDHPVSFTYNTALATSDGGLYDPSTANSGLGSTISADLLFSNKMECSSCHDVHNGANLSKLLRVSNAGSAFCLTCHNK